MIKRVFDFTVALLVLFVFALPLIIISLLIYLRMGKPIFFKQERPGLSGKTFKIYKFRTMKNAYDENGNLLDDSYRMTNLGRWLRKTSIDELPELFNVLKSDMSLVGPRPLLQEYIELYTNEQAKRHDVKPGITGWAQINGRNDLSWEDRFNLDLWYIEHQSILLDIRILVLTIVKVLKREGISQKGHVTMEKFRGTQK